MIVLSVTHSHLDSTYIDVLRFLFLFRVQTEYSFTVDHRYHLPICLARFDLSKLSSHTAHEADAAASNTVPTNYTNRIVTVRQLLLVNMRIPACEDIFYLLCACVSQKLQFISPTVIPAVQSLIWSILCLAIWKMQAKTTTKTRVSERVDCSKLLPRCDETNEQ